MFTLAHISDIHLSPLPEIRLGELMGQRILGYINWRRKRRLMHRQEILEKIVADMHAQAPDHIAVTGDLVNLGLPAEHARALEWLQNLGIPEQISVIPGNHDTYVHLRRDPGIARWQAYMSSNAQGKQILPDTGGTFPYVRVVGGVALIGLSSAIPTAPFVSAGEVGDQQRSALTEILERCATQNLFRVVMVHHPPVRSARLWMRGLRDTTSFLSIVMRHGAELVLHGHDHTHTVRHSAQYPEAPAILGVPSASLAAHPHKPLAGYHLYRISQRQRRWECDMVYRGLRTPDSSVEEFKRTTLINQSLFEEIQSESELHSDS